MKRSAEQLTFSNEFFEDEVREGFFVTSMMKRYWAAQLRVLNEFAKVCDKYDLKWFADYGTLIGAVRHGGYVPWDDDLDVSMLRKDWNKFFEVASSELPSGYRVLTINNEPEYTEFTGRIVNSGMIDNDPQHLEEFYGCPYTVGIDVFPLDNLYDDPELEEDRKKRAKEALDKYSDAKTNIQKNKCMRDIAKIHAECMAEDSQKVAMMTLYITKNDHVFPRDLYKDYVELPFENVRIRTTPQFIKMLRLEYKNFMRVVKGGGVHSYPVYAEQEEMLREKIGRNPYRYSFDSNELLVSVGRYIRRITNPQPVRQKQKIVYLPCKASHWKSMEPLWLKDVKNEKMEVHVLPIVFYETNYKGEIGEKHDERTMFPDYVKVEDCTTFDFEREHPDKIVIQVPYDGWSTSMTVHEFFYSGNLLGFTEELVYVPCFDVDDPCTLGDKQSKALETLIEQPAVINADKVILKSEMIRNLYLEKLIGYSGEQTRQYWEDKLVLMENLEEGFDCVNDEKDNEWYKLVAGTSGKKVLVYYLSISFLISGRDKALQKIRNSFDTFSENEDEIVAIVVPQDNITNELSRIDKGLYEQYQELIRGIGPTWKNIIYDEDGESVNHMDKWDIFFGDEGFLARGCVKKGIPVMVQNQNILSGGI